MQSTVTITSQKFGKSFKQSLLKLPYLATSSHSDFKAQFNNFAGLDWAGLICEKMLLICQGCN